MSDDRTKLGRLSFLQRPPVISGIQMRPVTAGTLELCRALGITFIDDFLSLAKLSEAEAQRQLFTFLFIHGTPDVDAMLAAVWLPKEEFRRHHLIPFAMPIEMQEVLPGVTAWLADVNAKVKAALFRTLAKPHEHQAEDPPPN